MTVDYDAIWGEPWGDMQDLSPVHRFAVDPVVERGFPFYSPLYRSAIEPIGGQTAKIGYSKRDRRIANALYQVYRLNSSRYGDVLMIEEHAA